MTPTAPSPAARPISRGPALVIACLAVAWCLVLGVLVLTAANPIVVNRVQVLHADVVAQGQWISGPTPQLDVQTLWKGELPSGRHPISGLLPEQRIEGEVIAPLSRLRDGRLVITGGKLANPPHDLQSGQVPAVSTVRPVVYPASEDVQSQLRDLLDEPLKASAP